MPYPNWLMNSKLCYIYKIDIKLILTKVVHVTSFVSPINEKGIPVFLGLACACRFLKNAWIFGVVTVKPFASFGNLG